MPTHSKLSISKQIFSLALPLAGTQLINVASGFLCMAMLASLGPQVLAASALIFSTELSIMVTGLSVLFSLSVLIGHAYGAQEYSKIGNFVQQGWTLGLLISVPLIVLFWQIKPILLYFGQSPEISAIVGIYFHAFAWCVIPELLAVTNQQFCYGIHKKMLIVSSSLMSVIVLLITAYILIFGKLGFPALGVAGLGYARATQNLFTFVFTTLFFYYAESFKKYHLFTYRVHQNMAHLSRMLKIGWPICMQMGGELLSFFLVGIFVGWLGTASLAALQVVNQYCFLIIITTFSLSQASGILVGQACGAKQFAEVKMLGFVSMSCVLIATMLITLIFIFAPMRLAALYVDINDPNNQQLLHMIRMLFIVGTFSLIFDGLRNLLIGVLRGLFDTKFPMVINLVVIWLIGVPLSYLFAFNLQLGVIGIALGSMLSLLIGAAIMLYRWYQLTNQLQGS